MTHGPNRGPQPEREFAMSATILSTNAVRAAYEASATLLLKWATAYDTVRADLAHGATLREVADDWKSAGIKPANKDSVSDMAEAARLTDAGEAYWAAVSAILGEGTVLLPHELIGRARKARGMTYVRATLNALRNVIGEDVEADADAILTVVTKVVRSLAAAKREVPKDDTTDDTTEDVTEDSDATEADDAPATGERTPDAMLAALAGPTVALRDMLDNDAQYDAARMDAWLTEVAAIARLHKGIMAARSAA